MRYRKIFKKKNTLLAVIHAQTLEQIKENIRIAGRGGADGIFLINHGDVSEEELMAFQVLSKKQFPDMWIGVNYLGSPIFYAFQEAHSTADGLWVDDAYVEMGIKREYSPVQYWKQMGALKFMSNGNRLYFGGFAFKYQEQPTDLALAAGYAKNYMDVVTTSGNATGEPPDIKKIETIREAIGSYPLAVASGMTPENVSAYRDLVDCFLVATGINKEGDFHNLDQKKVETFVLQLA